MVRLLALLCLGLLAIANPGGAFAGQRVALVIGNSAYANVPMLRQPAKDAEAVGVLLKNAGFDIVTVYRDLGMPQMRDAIRKFKDESRDANIAMVFYAGHGLELNGTNYLIPVDAKLESIADAPYEAISLDGLVAAVKPAGVSRRLNLIILDACRDNAFPAVRGSEIPIDRDRRPVKPADDRTLIAYSCKQGFAADGDGDHSQFTQALLRSLTVPGLDIRLAFGRIRDEVRNRTANKQEPYVYGALGGGSISLVQAPAHPEVIDADAEADFNLVTQIGTRQALEVFLATHKTGRYADLARARLDALAHKECPDTGRNQDASNIPLADQAARCAGQRKPSAIEKQ